MDRIDFTPLSAAAAFYARTQDALSGTFERIEQLLAPIAHVQDILAPIIVQRICPRPTLKRDGGGISGRC